MVYNKIWYRSCHEIQSRLGLEKKWSQKFLPNSHASHGYHDWKVVVHTTKNNKRLGNLRFYLEDKLESMHSQGKKNRMCSSINDNARKKPFDVQNQLVYYAN